MVTKNIQPIVQAIAIETILLINSKITTHPFFRTEIVRFFSKGLKSNSYAHNFFVGTRLSRLLKSIFFTVLFSSSGSVSASNSVAIETSAKTQITFSGWITNWDTPSQLTALKKQLSSLDTIWMYGANAKFLLSSETGSASPLEAWRFTKPMISISDLAKRKRIRIGPVIHNATEKGYDPNLALEIFKNPSVSISNIFLQVTENKWTAINVDLESLPATSANDYLSFLSALKKKFIGMDVKISVCLHPQTASEITDIAKFQNWSLLNLIDVDYVLMAYDHAWGTSPPGPISPLKWVTDVWENASRSFSNSNVILGLPLYGYHWKKNANGWEAEAGLSSDLAKRVKNQKMWIKTKTIKADGYNFTKKNQGISYDDEESIHLKLEELTKTGSAVPPPSRVALWRLVGSQGKLMSPKDRK